LRPVFAGEGGRTQAGFGQAQALPQKGVGGLVRTRVRNLPGYPLALGAARETVLHLG
jgi:hypothetical protein